METEKDLIYESQMDFDSLDEEQEVVLTEEGIVSSCGDLQVVASSNPMVWGILKGTFMEANVDNGNGRLYEENTLKQRVVEYPYTKRMIDNKSLLGEAHHPDDRTNIWMDESAISTTKLEYRPDGTVYGEADILKTPKGDIVNTLARYGTNIGISARATGKGVKRNGHLVISPDKYFFKTFDVVLNPGFEKARPQKFEADGSPMKVYEELDDSKDLLYEEIKSQIENKVCDKKMLQYYIDYSGNGKLEELKMLFEDVATDSISEDKGEVDMTEIETLKAQVEQLTEENNKLNSKIQNMTSDLEALQEDKKDYSDRLDFVNEEYSKESESASDQVEELLDILYQKNNEIYGLQKELNEAKEDLKNLRFNYAGLSSQVISLNEEKEETSKDSLLLEEKEREIESLEKKLLKARRTARREPLKEESVNEEAGKQPRKRVVPKKVDLFKNPVEAINEEQKTETKTAPVSRQVSLIKSLGGK